MAQIKPISAQELQHFYDNFEAEKSFLQTSQYGEWRTSVGEENFRFGMFEKNKLVGAFQFQKIKAKRGTYLHIPHGPLLDASDTSLIDSFLDWYNTFGKEQHCDFVRFSPLWELENAQDYLPTLHQKKYRPAPVHLVNPEMTWVLNLEPTEEEILANMKKSTRYEVRRIEKMGITVKSGNAEEDLEIFWQLHKATVERQGFVPFPKENTRKELEIFGKDIQIFSAQVEDKYLSSSIFWFDTNAAYYHQGSSEYSKLPVAHATIWEAIKEAKKRGCKEFNFWGVVCDKDTKHPWFGLSKFKRGFGGEERNYIHVHDFPLTSKYWLNFALEKYRRWKRGY